MNVMTHTAGQATVANTDRTGLLRLALKLDALASGAMGALILAGMGAAGQVVTELVGVPSGLMWGLGGFLVAYAAGVWLVGAPASINRTAAWSVVGLNLLWVIESVALVVLGWLPLTSIGVALVLVQAVAVLLLAGLQWLGLRRATA
jgi:hypothetical protein